MWALALLILTRRAEKTLDKQGLRQKKKKSVCVFHVHICVFTFISLSVCAWKCVPRIVCVHKQMDEKLRLVSLSVCFFFLPLNELRSKLCSALKDVFVATKHKTREQLCPSRFIRKSLSAPSRRPYLEFASLSPIITIHFGNWDDAQLSEIATVVAASLSPSVALLCILPQTW